MAINAYATLSDLAAYLDDELPPDSQRMLTRAQEVIDAACISAMYAIDAAGENPTDATVIAALNKATLAQVEWWIANGDEFDQMDRYSSFSVEGISVTRGATLIGRVRLCDRAWNALKAAKLLPGTIFST